MLGLGRKHSVEIRVDSRPLSDDGGDGETIFTNGNGQPASWVNVGSVNGIKQVMSLTDDELAALGKYGYIDVDRPEFGAVQTIETNTIW